MLSKLMQINLRELICFNFDYMNQDFVKKIDFNN